MSLIFCTTNNDKFATATSACQKRDIDLERIVIEIDEIQSEDPKLVLEHKINAIYDKVGKPLVVSDDSWSIPALNGFPGIYMKSMNYWFSAKDWLNIMSQYPDKTIYLNARLAYIDSYGTITFFEETREMKFLDKQSDVPGAPILQILSLPDDDTPISDLLKNNPDKYHSSRKLWSNFLDWYTENQPQS